MSEQPKWMATDDQIKKAIEGWYFIIGPGQGGNELEPFRALICSAVKKALAEVEAENAKLWACVEAADAYVDAVVTIEDSPAMQGVYSIAAVHHCPYNGANWSGELAQYRAARAEVTL